MTERPKMTVSATVLDSPDPEALAEFYHRLLGWPYGEKSPEWVTLRPPDSIGLSFQREERYRRPVWPSTEHDQQMSLHLDIGVEDLDQAVAYARSLGADVADFQPQEGVRVCLDPDGHPFCFFLPGY